MLNRFFKSSTAYAISLVMIIPVISFMPVPVSAQQCDAPYETITRLHHPEPGAFMVWNTIYGEEERQEKFVSAVGKDNGNVLAVGEVQITKGVRPSLMIVEFDRRGRKIWEKVHNIPYLENIVKIMPDSDGYIIVVNQEPPKRHGKVWIGFFDGEGKLKSRKIIENNSYDLLAKDIQSRVDGNGWSIPISSIRKIGEGEDEFQKNATVLVLDRKGNQVNSRAYILGLKTEISSLIVAKFDDDSRGYIATGYFENNNGKKIGWALRLNSDLSMVWQKEFSRGISANIVSAVYDKKGSVLVAGNVESADSGIGGTWLAKLNGASGKMDWQRYYMSETGMHSYSVRGVSVNKDGLIALLMMAESVDDRPVSNKGGEQEKDKMAGFGITSQSDYGHLLTLSPRGITLSGDAFYFGQSVHLSQLVESPSGQRIMVGHSLVKSNATMKKVRDESHSENQPLYEHGDVHLPEVDLSDETKKGLALLQKKINAQAVIDHKDNEEDHEESAKLVEMKADLVQKGWVVIGDMPDPYVDPCE